jgi:hypothetical protein
MGYIHTRFTGGCMLTALSCAFNLCGGIMEKTTEEIKELLDTIMRRYEHMQGWLLKIAMDSIDIHHLFYDETMQLMEEFQMSGHLDQSLRELKQLQRKYENAANYKLEIAEQWIERNKSEIERKKNTIMELVEEIEFPPAKKIRQA